MENEVKMPVAYSEFVRKRDAAYDGDPEGDYVLAQDVNELQESIERLERVVEVEGLGESVADSLKKKADKAAISDFGSPLFINYSGSSIGAYDSIEKRINAFAYIPHVVLRKELSADFSFLVKELKKSGTTLYGSVTCTGGVLNTIEADIAWFKQIGFDGILLNDFGFEGGLTRTAQNRVLETIRTSGMVAILTGEIETTLFGKPHSKNPQQLPLNISENDAYLAREVFISQGIKNTVPVIQAKALNLNKAQKELKIKILAEDTADASLDNTNLYLYGKMLATLYNLDGYCLAPKSRYALGEKVQPYLHGFDLGKWKTVEPVYVETATTVSRTLGRGQIVFDKNENTCRLTGVGLSPLIYTWQDKQIPGLAVDMATANYDDSALENLITAINGGNHQIHFSMVDGLDENGASPSLISSSVIRAINVSPAAVALNGDGGYDALAGNNFIHGALVDYIDAGSIKSGTLNIDHVKANIIEAINAYIGHAVIDSAYIGELQAEHISASVVDAINLYAEKALIGDAKIDSAVINELKAGHIEAVVIEAVNARIGTARIEAASIGELEARNIKTAVIEAVNASIEEAVIDSAKIGTLSATHISGMVVDAINLYAGTAKIKAAQIGSLQADNISAGLIEALEISASKAEFDSLKAAVISAINASLDNAFIDGAIIGEGTIDEAQIADGSITDAKIVSLVATKIAAGTIDTGKVKLQGDNGHLVITGNRLQVFDDQEVPIERVSVGDVNADGTLYGFRVRGADGQTVLYDEQGVYSEGITDGAITNPKIGTGAVDGSKHIAADTITGDKIVADTITGREVKAKSINANHMVAGTITAGSGVIAKGAIGEAEIADASITDAHIKSLKAETIEAGRIEMTSRNMVKNTTFREGFIGWAIDASVTNATISEVVTMSTTKSLQLFTTGKDGSLYHGAESTKTAAIGGEYYAASVYINTLNASAYDAGLPRLTIRFYHDDILLAEEHVNAESIAENQWQRLSIVQLAPSTTTYVSLRVSHQRNGDTFICRAMLQKGKFVTEWSGDGSYLTDDGVYTGELHADQITAGSIRADLIQIGPDTTFEDGYSPGDLRQEMEERIPYKVEIISSNGLIFRRGQISTTLTATVYKGADDFTDQIDEARFIWKRVSMDSEADTAWNTANSGKKQVTITGTDVNQRATFLCEILE